MYPPETRFIVVDDFATMRKIIKKVLLQLGFSHIAEADCGTKAIKMLSLAADEGRAYDFIISDLSMPGMTGTELLKSCKATTDLKEIPFLLVTAESEQASVQKTKGLGDVECITKPFNAATLKEKLANTFNQTQAHTKQAS